MNAFLFANFIACWVIGRSMPRPQSFEENLIMCALIAWMLFCILFLQWRVYS